MTRQSFDKRIAIIKVQYVSDKYRSGMIVFASDTYTEDTTAEAYSGLGYTFLATYTETSHGVTFGGYVSSPKMAKDDPFEPPDFFINLNPYTGEKDNIAYSVKLTQMEGREFGDVLFGGLLYKGILNGVSEGTLSTLINEEEEAPAPKPRGKSKTKTQSPTTTKEKKHYSYPKNKPNEDDTIPF